MAAHNRLKVAQNGVPVPGSVLFLEKEAAMAAFARPKLARPNSGSEFCYRLMKQVVSDYNSACEHMDHEQLTEEQAFAVGTVAGVPLGWPSESGQLQLAPCAIVAVDGMWNVYYRREP